MKMNKQILADEWRRVAPRLCQLCDEVTRLCPIGQNVRGYIEPERLAAAFRNIGCLSTPFGLPAAERLVERLGLVDIVLYQRELRKLTAETRASGFWQVVPECLLILIDAPRLRANGLYNRPDGSIVFTLLHELAEVIAAILTARGYHKYELSGLRLENWANHFAAHVLMPELEFRPLSHLSGLDVRMLIQNFGSTVASTTRHIRDLVSGKLGWMDVFYHCRCEFVHDLERVSPDLLSALESSCGYCVRTWDAVYTKGMLKKSRYGSLPMYNLAGVREQRIIHPSFKPLYEDNKPLLIQRVAGASSYEHGRNRDLYDLRDLTFLALPYGSEPVKGFFVIGVHCTDAESIAPQVEKYSPHAIGEIDWLMSSACAKAPRVKKKPKPQTNFDYFAEERMHFTKKQYRFVKHIPLS